MKRSKLSTMLELGTFMLISMAAAPRLFQALARLYGMSSLELQALTGIPAHMIANAAAPALMAAGIFVPSWLLMLGGWA